MNKNKRLYQCDDCRNRQFVAKIELSRRSKPRCNKCGCQRLEPVSDDAKAEIVDIATSVLIQALRTENKMKP